MKRIEIKTHCKKLLSDIYTPVGIYLRLRDRFRDTVLLESADYHAADNSFFAIEETGLAYPSLSAAGGDAADEMDAPMAPSLFGYCKVGAYEYNPARAKQLLTEAGVKPGTKLSFHHPTGRYVQDKEAAQAVAGYLREVGIEPVSARATNSGVVMTSTEPRRPDRNSSSRWTCSSSGGPKVSSSCLRESDHECMTSVATVSSPMRL